MKAEKEVIDSFITYKAWVVSKLYCLPLTKIHIKYVLKLKYIQMSPKDQFLIIFEKGDLDYLFVFLDSFHPSPTKTILESHKFKELVNKNIKGLTDKNIKRIWD